MARTKDFDEDEVLSKAMYLFWDKGYNGTSMQDLIDGLGISRSSLYSTYGDKYALFVKSLGHYRNTASENLRSIIAASPSARETVRRLLDYVVDQMTRDPQNKGCFLVNSTIELASHDEEINKMLCDNDQEMEELLRETVEKGQASGEINTHQDAATTARFIVNNIKGMRVSARSGADKNAFNEIVDTIMATLL